MFPGNQSRELRNPSLHLVLRKDLSSRETLEGDGPVRRIASLRLDVIQRCNVGLNRETEIGVVHRRKKLLLRIPERLKLLRCELRLQSGRLGHLDKLTIDFQFFQSDMDLVLARMGAKRRVVSVRSGRRERVYVLLINIIIGAVDVRASIGRGKMIVRIEREGFGIALNQPEKVQRLCRPGQIHKYAAGFCVFMLGCR